MKIIRGKDNEIVMYRHWFKWYMKVEYLALFQMFTSPNTEDK